MSKKPKKTMSVEDLTAYMDDLIRMEFVAQYKGEDGILRFRLTDLGRKAGMSENFKKHQR